jgi:hypothetical protein
MNLKNVVYIHTMEFYLAIKKNRILSFAGKWTELKNIMLNKVNQVQKDLYVEDRSKYKYKHMYIWDC